MSGKLSPIRLSGILLFASTLLIVAGTFQYEHKKTSYGEIMSGRISHKKNLHHTLHIRLQVIERHLESELRAIRALNSKFQVIERHLESELRALHDLDSPLSTIERDCLMQTQEKVEFEFQVTQVKNYHMQTQKKFEPPIGQVKTLNSKFQVIERHLESELRALRALNSKLQVIERNLESELRALHALDSQLSTIERDCLMKTQVKGEFEPQITQVKNYPMQKQEKEEIEPPFGQVKNYPMQTQKEVEIEPPFGQVKTLNFHKREETYDEAERLRIIGEIRGVRRLCTAEEEGQTNCLNRGVCYLVRDLNAFACNCLSAYCGPKCEIKAGKNLC